MKKRKRKPLAKRLMALLLIGVLLAPALPAQTALADTTPEAPEVRVTATVIGGQYVEVGLNIDSKEGGKFQSAGVLLTYDPEVLIPIGWGDNTALAIPAVTEAAEAGKAAAILPAKGADALSGKLAEAVTVDGKGYLYLSAETARAMAGLRQTLPAEKSAEELDPALPTATTSGKAISYIQKAETAAEYAAVVRFVLKAKPGMELYDDSEIVAALDVVPAADAAAASFPLPDAPMTYLSDNTDHTTAGKDTSATLKFVWVLDGVTANAGTGDGADLNSIATFTIFDATGEYLGAVSVAKDSKPEDVVSALEAFAKGLYHGFVTQAEAKENPALTATLPTTANGNPTYYKGDLLEGVPANSTSYYDYTGTQWPLSYKKGYNFAGWAQVTGSLSDMYTTVGAQAELDALLLDLSEAPQDGWQSMSLMAAYVGDNTLSKDNSGISNERYTLLKTDYNKYGANSYSIKITIQRENQDGHGSTRLRDPALRVTATVGGETVYMAVKIDNIDQATGEIVLPRGAEDVSVMLVDFAEGADWTAASRKLPDDIQYNKTKKDDYDFLYNGTVSYICESAVLSLNNNNGQWSLVIRDTLNDAALDCSNEAQPDFNSTNATFLLNNAKNKILLAFVGTDKTYMTQTELQEAISMAAGTVRTPAQYNSALSKVQAALDYSLEKHGCALTITEVAQAARGEYIMS